VTNTGRWPASRSPVTLTIYLRAGARSPRTSRRMVVARSNCSRLIVVTIRLIQFYLCVGVCSDVRASVVIAAVGRELGRRTTGLSSALRVRLPRLLRLRPPRLCRRRRGLQSASVPRLLGARQRRQPWHTFQCPWRQAASHQPVVSTMPSVDHRWHVLWHYWIASTYIVTYTMFNRPILSGGRTLYYAGSPEGHPEYEIFTNCGLCLFFRQPVM